MSDPFNKKQPNAFVCIGNSFYIVQTHTGYKQALSHWKGDRVLMDMEIRGVPTKFPAMVHFSFGHTGYSYIDISSTQVDKVKEAIKKSEPTGVV